ARRQLQPVAHAPHRLDARGRDLRSRELLADLLHVDVDRAGVTRKVVAPDQIQQLAALKTPAGMTRQQRQEVELLWPELDSSAALTHLMALEVDFELARPDQLGLVGLEASPTQQRLGTRH